MKNGLFAIFTCLCLFASGDNNCFLKIGDLQFSQPPGVAEPFTNVNGDTTWRIRYTIPPENKQKLLDAIFGAMFFECNDGISAVKYFNLQVIGEKPEDSYMKYVTKNYILREDVLEKIFSGKHFTIYLDNIYLFAKGRDVQSVAIEYHE